MVRSAPVTVRLKPLATVSRETKTCGPICGNADSSILRLGVNVEIN